MYKTNRNMECDMKDPMTFPGGNFNGAMEGACCPPMMGSVCDPIYECPCEKVCQREINHHVPHIQPVHTRVINRHIYHHSYQPCYTMSEENVVFNVYGGNPCCR